MTDIFPDSAFSVEHFIAQLPSGKPLICLDYGASRIGIARSDPKRIYSLSGETYHRRNMRQDIGYLADIFRSRECCGWVIGRPYESDGADGELCADIDAFCMKLLKKANAPLYFIDERMSTAAVTRIFQAAGKKRRDAQRADDAAAAALLLQNVLDRISNA